MAGGKGVNAADLVCGACLLCGGGLLLLALIVDDIFGGLLGAIHVGFDVAGVSPTPMLLGFIAMFGVGGLFGLHSLNAGPGGGTVVGVISGLLGAGVVFGAFKALRSAESPETFSLQAIIVSTATVLLCIPANKVGSVLISFAGAS